MAKKFKSSLTIANIVKRERNKLYDENKNEVKERNARKLFKTILWPAVDMELSEVRKTLCGAYRKYNAWYRSKFSKREPSKSENLSLFFLSFICTKLRHMEAKTFTRSKYNSLLRETLDALQDHAKLWSKRRKRNKR